MVVELGLFSDRQVVENPVYHGEHHYLHGLHNSRRMPCELGPYNKEGSVLSSRSWLTDRAAANHAAIRIVNEKFGTTLIEGNCHLHPLDSIANKCKSTLKSLETSKTHLFGPRCCAVKVIQSDHNLPQSLVVVVVVCHDQVRCQIIQSPWCRGSSSSDE